MTGSSTTTIRLTAEERAALYAASDASGLGPCSYARRAVVRAIGREPRLRRRPDGLAQEIGQALGDLGRIGNNLNQLVRHAHKGGGVEADALAAVRTELSLLSAAVMALREPHS